MNSSTFFNTSITGRIISFANMVLTSVLNLELYFEKKLLFDAYFIEQAVERVLSVSFHSSQG